MALSLLCDPKAFSKARMALELQKLEWGGEVKFRELVTKIERDGWKRVFSRGGHLQYKHPSKKGRVTVSGHPKDDVHPKTLRSILKQAGLK